ncbi:MAG: hypothetical protein WBP59_12025 [Ilumatobacteraceae bacterium]
MITDSPSPAHRLTRLGVALALGTLALSSCGKATETGIEQLVESQTGGDIDLDLNGDGGFSIDTGEGSMTIDEDGNFVVTDQDGEVITGNASEDGDFNIQSEDGEFSLNSGAGIPDEWPGEIPRPEAMSDITSSMQSGGDGFVISVTGRTEPGFHDAYATMLEGIGLERTSTYESGDTVSSVYESTEWSVSVNSYADGDDVSTVVTLISK